MNIIKNFQEIQNDIKEHFYNITGNRIENGTVLDLYSLSISKGIENVYEEIDNAKNPHIYTNIRGKDLDFFGAWLNMPRAEDESDDQYLYRITEWMITKESSNSSAIRNSLLNLEYSSHAEYMPLTNGSGTGTVIIIPKKYEYELMESAKEEVKERLAKSASPSLVVDYIFPDVKFVKINFNISYFENYDPVQVKANIEERLKNHINNIPINEELKIGSVARIAMLTDGVDYIDVSRFMIDNREIYESTVKQRIDSKFILDEIIWNEV